MLKGLTSDDVILRCAGCHSEVMERGSDTVGWKGVQLTDDPLILSWYCPRDVCKQTMRIAFSTRVREMRIARGLDPNPPPRQTMKEGYKLPRSPMGIGKEGSGHTMALPPGGFQEPPLPPIEEEK